MIRECADSDFDDVLEIINDAAQAYKGVIPSDCWNEPYMAADELRREMEADVRFLGYEENGELIGVMGLQDVQDVTLIRHAYVRTAWRSHGVGGKLLAHLVDQTTRPVLIGTWADANWAIRFYQNRGFRIVSTQEKDRLLQKYWSVPERQRDTSVVLANAKWFVRGAGPFDTAPQ